MRLKVTKSKNSASLYIIKSIYNPKTQSNTSVIVEKLGTEAELREKLNGADPYEWAKKYIEKLNKQEQKDSRKVLLPFSQSKLISKNEQRSFNGGYLFLQQLYHRLKLDCICKDISSRYKFQFNLDSILSRLIYGKIIFPTSKLGTFELSQSFLEVPDFEIQHIYRALEVIAAETDFIQAELYKNSLAISKRNDKILYYDCTNYFFEIEEAEGLKQYGKSKQHQPSPIVEIGLFMDGDGIPLAFNIHSGNTNEQITLRPLEEQILRDFELSKFVVCTDAGLSSSDNRKFNNIKGSAFITTQSVKKLKAHLKKWALDSTGWRLSGDQTSATYNITQLEESKEMIEKFKNATFYKERWIKEDALEQKLIVTFSLIYRDYQSRIRNSQIERAEKLITTRPTDIKKKNQNDFKRFIKSTGVTTEGEIAEKTVYDIDQDAIAKEEMFDGFYAVCTNLEDDAPEIAKINHKRWEIEECFRILKTDSKARPIYLRRDNRIKAHFTTCFLALTLYKYLDKELKENYTSDELITTLRKMNFYSVSHEGYIPTYKRTNLTDALHETFGFRSDYEIVTTKQMKKIFKDTKK
ncbi:DDE family transposase [Lachnotalea glycerini]|uniref:DDE family transposase n=1 Tax=Lachnotalea glycerini TaxID=1763509 RepID=A0A255IC57_9FIRM|nr:IS1634 family transposase [Lachnotalea glycerini]PXV93351.1 DDE family transposase [Lachnotalea glycerini]RDY32025.1 IS1634 family transposase [Lachnotalea glycerini]